MNLLNLEIKSKKIAAPNIPPLPMLIPLFYYANRVIAMVSSADFYPAIVKAGWLAGWKSAVSFGFDLDRSVGETSRRGRPGHGSIGLRTCSLKNELSPPVPRSKPISSLPEGGQ